MVHHAPCTRSLVLIFLNFIPIRYDPNFDFSLKSKTKLRGKKGIVNLLEVELHLECLNFFFYSEHL